MMHFCIQPAWRFLLLGLAFVAVGWQAPGFLPVGLVFLVLAAVHRLRRAN